MHAKVAIGIQARSTSKRFPGKVHEKVGGLRLVDAVAVAAAHVEERPHVYLLVPKGDELAHPWFSIEGDENDVLSRFVRLQEKTEADYIVRLTADCPLIPTSTISALIRLAIDNQYDYVSNVDEKCRTAPDGWDCEVMSRHMLRWLDENATLSQDREHVTLLCRMAPPPWARRGVALYPLDLSKLKISVDTPEDLAEVRLEHDAMETARRAATVLYGEDFVHIL